MWYAGERLDDYKFEYEDILDDLHPHGYFDRRWEVAKLALNEVAYRVVLVTKFYVLY